MAGSPVKRTVKATLFYGGDLSFLHSRYYAEFVTRAAPQAIRMLLDAGVKNGLVCDIGCGGGQLSTSLLKAGYEVIGVDVSAAMLALARKRAPAATFIRGSIADVHLPACNAAVAMGEVFNYLGTRSKMKRAFGNLFDALPPGGILIFDIKEPAGQNLARVSCRIGADWAIFAEIEEDPSRSRLLRKIHSFRRIGQRYRRQTEVHELGIYPATEVSRMLRSVGFQVRARTGYGSYKLTGDRKVLIARRPA